MAAAFDAVAEALVVPSFSRIGFAARSRLEHWAKPPVMRGQVAVITGASSGIGLAAAAEVARLGASVHMVGHSPERAERARREVAREAEADVIVDVADMAEPGEVKALGRALAHRYQRIDVILHCAGSLSRSYQANSKGTELTVAAHLLGPYVLTSTIAPRLGGMATVVIVSSGGMYGQRFDLTQLEMGSASYNGVKAYARAKRAQVVLAAALSRHLSSLGVSACSMHPGWVATSGLRAGLPAFYSCVRPLLRTPAEGADTAVWLASGGSRVEDGSPPAGFYLDRRRRREQRFPIYYDATPDDGDRLLAWCAERAGVEPPSPGRAGDEG
jgi:dehydrogenase/reductase SDR family member 12